jgi:hypothetical protein
VPPRPLTIAGAALAFAVLGAVLPSGAQAVPSAGDVIEVCRFSDDRLDEISGMTYSQRHDGVMYLHNDSSGGPRIYAVDATTCDVIATLTVAGIEARDLEAIGSGRDAKGRPVLWLGDIGDNLDSWPEVRLHRVREPKRLRDRTLTPRTYRVTYPDRPHNAEALLADPDSPRVWVVTKQAASGTIYALPRGADRGEVTVLEPVGEAGAFVTDGSVSPDGSRFALRDYVDAEVRLGLPPGSDPQTVYLPLQLQGEALTWTADGSALLVAGERDDRLLRVSVAPAPDAPVPSPSASTPPPSPSASASSDGASSPAADDRQPTAGTGGGWVVPGVAALLVAAALAVIGVAEWRRRRG